MKARAATSGIIPTPAALYRGLPGNRTLQVDSYSLIECARAIADLLFRTALQQKFQARCYMPKLSVKALQALEDALVSKDYRVQRHEHLAVFNISWVDPLNYASVKPYKIEEIMAMMSPQGDQSKSVQNRVIINAPITTRW
jgi:hypothetical protein